MVRDVHNLGGRVGAWIADLMLYLFGVSAYLWAAFMLLRVVSGYRLLHRRRLAAAGGPTRHRPTPSHLLF